LDPLEIQALLVLLEQPVIPDIQDHKGFRDHKDHRDQLVT